MSCKFWILDFGFWIGGIAALYLLLKQTEYLKSKIRNPKSKIITLKAAPPARLAGRCPPR
jgi:hypothetical protein